MINIAIHWYQSKMVLILILNIEWMSLWCKLPDLPIMYLTNRTNHWISYNLILYTNETMFTRCRYGAKTAWKSYFFRFCSHDAGTKLYDTVTFTVTKQCRFPNGMRWKRNALRYRVNTENGIFWYRFSSQLSTLKLFYLFTFWHQIQYSNSIVNMANLIYYLRT